MQIIAEFVGGVVLLAIFVIGMFRVFKILDSKEKNNGNAEIPRDVPTGVSNEEDRTIPY